MNKALSPAELQASVVEAEDRAANGDADRAAEIAHGVEQAAGIFQPLRRPP